MPDQPPPPLVWESTAANDPLWSADVVPLPAPCPALEPPSPA